MTIFGQLKLKQLCAVSSGSETAVSIRDTPHQERKNPETGTRQIILLNFMHRFCILPGWDLNSVLILNPSIPRLCFFLNFSSI